MPRLTLMHAPGRYKTGDASAIDNWREFGACAAPDADADLWFPLRDDPDPIEHPVSAAQTAAAKHICATCPVLAACRRNALAEPQEHGVQAGLTPAERRATRTGAREAVRAA